jgi:hypothetical protein
VESRTRRNQKLFNDIWGRRLDRSTGKMAKIKQYWDGGVSQNRMKPIEHLNCVVKTLNLLWDGHPAYPNYPI